MNYSRLIWFKEVVCVGHERLTMSKTRTGEMNFLFPFVPCPLRLSVSGVFFIPLRILEFLKKCTSVLNWYDTALRQG
jgi:hypothetical protein